MVRCATAAPFAEPANTEILGWLTQLGTRISLRTGSQATAPGVPKVASGASFGALRMKRSGATSPLARSENTLVRWLPQLVTHSSLRRGSTARPVGALRFA